MRMLVFCATSIALIAAAPGPVARTAAAQAKLDKFLAGRIAGPAERCLTSAHTNSPVGIDDQTMLFKDGPRIWRNDLKSGFRCGDLGGRKSLVSRGVNIKLCNGDTVNIVDLTDGSGVGGCILGDFVPYTKP